MTADEFFALGETTERLELIDGVIAMSPSATPIHQKICLRIAAQLDAFSSGMPGLEVLLDVDLQVRPNLVYRPDIAVYLPGTMSGLPDRLTTPADLIVEVLSPGTKAMDLVTKRGDYEAFGVGEYWTVDSTDARIRAWKRQGTRLVEATEPYERLLLDRNPQISVDFRPIRALIGM